MRKISQEQDYGQIFIILSVIFLYFKFAYFLRDDPFPATLTYSVFIIHFFASIGFFYFMANNSSVKNSFSSFLFTFTYSLLPTLIWFASNSVLYIFVPPPRSYSILGKGFSIFFIAYTISLFAWKIILTYLALRFSTKANFYKIFYLLLLFFIWFIPYSVFLYHVKIFRIPFI